MQQLRVDGEVGVQVVVVANGAQRVVVQVIHRVVGGLLRIARRLTRDAPVEGSVERLVPHHLEVLGTLAGRLHSPLRVTPHRSKDDDFHDHRLGEIVGSRPRSHDLGDSRPHFVFCLAQ